MIDEFIPYYTGNGGNSPISSVMPTDGSGTYTRMLWLRSSAASLLARSTSTHNSEIAAVASYVRNAWGNEAAEIDEGLVGAQR